MRVVKEVSEVSESAPRLDQSVAAVWREGKGKGYAVYRTAADALGLAKKKSLTQLT